MVEEIDGRPALEVFKAEIGELLSRDLRRIAGYIFAALPVSGTDRADYLVRNIIGIDVAQGRIALAIKTEDDVVSIHFARRSKIFSRAKLHTFS